MGQKGNSKEWIIKILLAICIFLGGFAISQMTVVAKVETNTNEIQHNKEDVKEVDDDLDKLIALMSDIIGQNNILINELKER